MSSRLDEHDRFQLWCLMELAGSAEGLLAAERHLSLLFGRRPTLFELVDELLERHHRAETPEEPAVEAWIGT